MTDPARGIQEFLGWAWGAISIVNAIPSGIGCSAAIRLPVAVNISVREESPSKEHGVGWVTEAPTPLLRMVLDMALEKADRSRSPSIGSWRIRVESEIPPSKGLKSSSAVSVALGRAALSALGLPHEEMDVAILSSSASLKAGVSVTGAFDDATTAASGGVVVSDVRARRVIARGILETGLEAVVWIPEATHGTPSQLRDLFEKESADSRHAIELALKGRYLAAMEMNSRIVERALGYDYGDLHRRGREAGALASGVSGNGPSVAFLTPAEKAGAVSRALPSQGARVLRLAFAGPGERPT